jgi:hypothetical protein
MCLRRAPEKYIAGAALDRAGLDNMGSFTSHNPIGLHDLLRVKVYTFFFTLIVPAREFYQLLKCRHWQPGLQRNGLPVNLVSVR